MKALKLKLSDQFTFWFLFVTVLVLLVGGVLYLFRKIYGEVVGALPLNGGLIMPYSILPASKRPRWPLV